MTFWPIEEERNLVNQLIRFGMMNDERNPPLLKAKTGKNDAALTKKASTGKKH